MLKSPLIVLSMLASAAFVGGCSDSPQEQTSTTSQADSVRRTPEAASINLGYFSRSPVVGMAQTHGFFADENLTVAEFQTPSSPTIFKNLRDSVWHVILTQSDNVFNYRNNASNPLGATFEPVIFAGTDWGNGASLMTRPGLTTCESLRGKNLEVDSPNSGFAFVAYGVLRNKCGFERTTDYAVVVTGGTPLRYKNLVAGTNDMTILNAGYQFRAEAKGMSTFGVLSDAANPFMGGSVVALRSWLDGNRDVAIRFIRAMQRGTQHVLDPANKPEIITWLTADAGGDANVANRTYQVLITRGDGLIPDMGLDRKGLLGTGQLRDSFGGFDQPVNLRYLTSPKSGMYDLSYWRRATPHDHDDHDDRDDHEGDE
jgi:ABC-type nitrate/sulfonate/bicarbonate transport system substrate-binding protein